MYILKAKGYVADTCTYMYCISEWLDLSFAGIRLTCLSRQAMGDRVTPYGLGLVVVENKPNVLNFMHLCCIVYIIC